MAPPRRPQSVLGPWSEWGQLVLTTQEVQRKQLEDIEAKIDALTPIAESIKKRQGRAERFKWVIVTAVVTAVIAYYAGYFPKPGPAPRPVSTSAPAVSP